MWEISLLLDKTPSHASIPQNQNDTMAKAGLMRWEIALRKIQTSSRAGVSFQAGRATVSWNKHLAASA